MLHTPDTEETSRASALRSSIVVPCYQGEAFVAASLERLLEFLRANDEVVGPFEVICVDDGSRDSTAEIIESEFPEMTLLRHERNRGKGAAVRTGVLAASGAFVFFIDADVPYDLASLVTMLDYLDRKEFHLCIGTRSRLPDSHPVRRRLLRRIASFLFTEFVSRIVVTGVRDTQCGFKGFQRKVAHYLFSESRCENFAFDVEVLYLAFKSDLDIKKIPVRLCAEDHSSVSLPRHGLPMLFELLRIPLRYYRGRYSVLRHRPGDEDSPWGA